MNDAGRHIREQFTDTGGFTDHVFAACAILGYRFAPRIRDLPSKRLYAFNPSAAPAHLRALIGGKINQAMIERNWPDILRIAATIAAGSIAPMGTTASSDGQFFPSARQGEAMNMVNAKYGNEPGLKAYTHVNDQFAPFASQTIPATVSEAPYILDGLLMNEAGRQVGEQYADTAGFTDHLFGTSAMLGYRLVLRIRYLPSKRLYVFNPAGTPKDLRKLVGGKIREELIVANWPDLFRCAATMAAGKIKPSQLLRKLASYPRQNDLAVALREVGRVERTLFIIEWILDTDMQRRAQIGLNKGEAHHALKNALRIGRQGEIRDRTTEGQHYRIAGLNLLTAIIIYWNTVHIGHAVAERRNEGLDVPPELLAHISPLGWAHILLTGEYLWPQQTNA